MQIFGREYSAEELRRRVGNMDQIAGIRTVKLDDANERPTRAALFHTGTGFQMTVLLDRALDIASADYCGKAMGWRSTTGDVAPQYFEAEGIRWLRSYFGGLVTTCGLTNVGAPAPDSALAGNGLHGRIGNLPARNICVKQEWEGDKYVLSVTGTIRETSVFGENLTLTRTVSTCMGESKFRIHDVVTNEGFNDTPYMLLYHCNLGWPALDEGSEIIAPSRYVAPRDSEAEDGKENWYKMDAPTHGYKEKCYYHDMAPDASGNVVVALVNNKFNSWAGFGVYLKYSKEQLPRFVQWKQMGEQDYVLGFEPCNCGVEGRKVDEEQGLLHVLKPGQRQESDLEFGVILTQKEADALRNANSAINTEFKKSYKEFVKKQ